MESLKNLGGCLLGLVLVIAYLAVGVLLSYGASYLLGGPDKLSANSRDMLLLVMFIGPGILVYLAVKALDYVRGVPKSE